MDITDLCEWSGLHFFLSKTKKCQPISNDSDATSDPPYYGVVVSDPLAEEDFARLDQQLVARANNIHVFI